MLRNFCEGCQVDSPSFNLNQAKKHFSFYRPSKISFKSENLQKMTMMNQQDIKSSGNKNSRLNVTQNLGSSMCYKQLDRSQVHSRSFLDRARKIHENPQIRSELKPTYDELLSQNKRLKALIKEQYEPMEQTYKKMIEEKDDREYLIARLEWKIKQLAASLQDQNLSFIEQLQR